LAYQVTIHCPDAEEIVRLLNEKHGADYSRVWHVGNRTIGVFSFEWTAAFGGYVNLITLDHDKTSGVCEVTIIGAGGVVPSFDSMFGSGSPGTRAARDLASLAKEHSWQIQLEQAKIKFRGSECPLCGAAYVYSKDRIRRDGSVICQNCGKTFFIEKKRRYSQRNAFY
jgi:predicted RNA-binding Zn-ribbon protein involved in translation (DUF1610 family)